MANIKLNFLSIRKSKFEFPIYRRLKTDLDEKTESVFFYYLPQVAGEGERMQYCVSFQPFANAENFVVSSFDSIDLTKRFLYYSLLASLDKSGCVFPYAPIKRFTDSRVEFTIDEVTEGKKVVFLIPYFLEDQAKFGFLIDYKFSKFEHISFDKKIQVHSLSLDKNFRSNKNYYADKFHILSWFIDKSYESWKLLAVENGEPIEIKNYLNESPVFSLSKKEYIFNNGSVGYSQFHGIKNYGPFGKLDSEVIFVFLFEERFKSFANELYLSLIGKTNPGTFPGFESIFKLKIGVQNVKQVRMESYEKGKLDEAVDQVKAFKQEGRQVIGIFIEDYNQDRDSEASDVYYYFKYRFIKENIPLQVVNYRKLGDKNSLKWSTSNIALAIFSKLGGIPWLVKPNNTNCLILGIGSSHRIDKETKKTSRYFAYSVCLDSSGLYKRLEVLADESSQEHYLERLQSNLTALLKSDLLSNYSSCVLHLPFKIKQSEIEALSKAVQSVKELRFVAIKINTNNKFFGFSGHNTFVPYESNFIKLAGNQYLVWFEGLQFGKEVVDKRLASPVHIEFLNFDKEKQADEKNFLQDVLNLSGANWRGFNAKSIPISIYYSQLIASYMEEFERIEGYEEINLSNTKPWFL